MTTLHIEFDAGTNSSAAIQLLQRIEGLILQKGEQCHYRKSMDSLVISVPAARLAALTTEMINEGLWEL